MQTSQLGPYLIYYDDPETFHWVLAHGMNYEPHLRDELKIALEHSRRFMDIGSNAGTHTVSAKIWRGLDFPTISVDVNPHNCELLCRTIVENKFTNSMVLPVAASDHVGVVLGNRCWNTGLAEKAVNADWTATYPCMPMDMIGVSPVDTIKIDVEGFELSALRGLVCTITRDLPTIFFEYNLHCLKIVGVDPVELLGFLPGLGYELTILDYKPGMRRVITDPVQGRDYIAQFGEICDIMAKPKPF